MKDIKSFIVCSDQHTPFHDKKVHQSFLKFIKDFKPDGFIINGDFVDMYSISSFIRGLTDLEDDNKIIKLEKEFAVANSVLDDYDKVLPKCEKHYLFGNHSMRLENWLAEANRGVLAGLISVEKNLYLKERGYKVYPNYPNNYLTLGKLTITHGAWVPIYTASKHLNEYRQSVLFGHSHTVQMFYAGGLGVKQVGINIGHLCDVNSKGMQYAKRTSRWVQGFAIVYVDRKGYFWVELLNFFLGKLIYNKKIY
mgnify:FL=1